MIGRDQQFETIQRSDNGMTFSALASGLQTNPDGPVVIMLHGFPDSARTYRLQLPELEAAGYRALATVSRGYEPSSQPEDRDYSLRTLAGDVLAWIDHLGEDRVHLVGHDWGGLITCAAGAIAPERFLSLTVDTGLHIARANRIVGKVPRQLLLSWYITFFQLRGGAELAIKRPGWPLLRRLWRDWAPGYHLPGTEWRYLCDQFAQRGVVDAALCYYRQNASPGVFTGLNRLGMEACTSVPVRTLVIAGLDDGCFDHRIYEQVFLEEDFPAGLRLEKLAGVGHCPHLEKPKVFNEMLLDWLAAEDVAA